MFLSRSSSQGGGLFFYSAALNRVTAVVIGSYKFASFITMGVAALFMLLIWGVKLLIPGHVTDFTSLGQTQYWYLWTAGPVALFPVLSDSTAPAIIGYAFYVSILVAGLLFFSTMLDTFHVRVCLRVLNMLVLAYASHI